MCQGNQVAYLELCNIKPVSSDWIKVCDIYITVPIVLIFIPWIIRKINGLLTVVLLERHALCAMGVDLCSIKLELSFPRSLIKKKKQCISLITVLISDKMYYKLQNHGEAVKHLANPSVKKEEESKTINEKTWINLPCDVNAVDSGLSANCILTPYINVWFFCINLPSQLFSSLQCRRQQMLKRIKS